MKIKITDVSDCDVYFNVKDEIIGREFTTDEVYAWKDGWHAVRCCYVVGDDVVIYGEHASYFCFFEVKFEVVEE